MRFIAYHRQKAKQTGDLCHISSLLFFWILLLSDALVFCGVLWYDIYESHFKCFNFSSFFPRTKSQRNYFIWYAVRTSHTNLTFRLDKNRRSLIIISHTCVHHIILVLIESIHSQLFILFSIIFYYHENRRHNKLENRKLATISPKPFNWFRGNVIFRLWFHYFLFGR